MDVNLDDKSANPTVLIKGLFSLPKYIRFVRERCVPRTFDDAALVAEWREARTRAIQLMAEESGIADSIQVQELPEEMKPLADKVLEEPSMHRLMSLVSRRWCMVEIDRLVIFQDSINLRHVAKLRDAITPNPSAQEIMELASCTGAHAHPAVRSIQCDGGYTFSSESNDLRFLDVVTVDPKSVQDYEPFGTASHAIVIYLGFSDNTISATRSGSRIILTNGSHRVYALRELGFRFVPCLLTDASDGDVSDFLLPADVKQDPQFYLKAPRPPLFKDYVNPDLTRIVPVVGKNFVLQARLDLQRTIVPAL